jgi:hypothetical protein
MGTKDGSRGNFPKGVTAVDTDKRGPMGWST